MQRNHRITPAEAAKTLLIIPPKRNPATARSTKDGVLRFNVGLVCLLVVNRSI